MPRKNTANKAEEKEQLKKAAETPSTEAVENDEKQPEEKEQLKKAAETPSTEDSDNAVIDRILRMNHGYAEVYIDQKGGVFAPGTPQSVRGNAKLYKNKYHK